MFANARVAPSILYPGAIWSWGKHPRATFVLLVVATVYIFDSTPILEKLLIAWPIDTTPLPRDVDLADMLDMPEEESSVLFLPYTNLWNTVSLFPAGTTPLYRLTDVTIQEIIVLVTSVLCLRSRTTATRKVCD